MRTLELLDIRSSPWHRLPLHHRPYSQHLHSFRPAPPMNVFPRLPKAFRGPRMSAQVQVVRLKCHALGQGWCVIILDYHPLLLPSSRNHPTGRSHHLRNIPFCLGFLAGWVGSILIPFTLP
jgi:hypothetical protein